MDAANGKLTRPPQHLLPTFRVTVTSGRGRQQPAGARRGAAGSLPQPEPASRPSSLPTEPAPGAQRQPPSRPPEGGRSWRKHSTYKASVTHRTGYQRKTFYFQVSMEMLQTMGD